MPPLQAPKPEEEKNRSSLKAAARYSGMAFQLFGACLLGVFLGRWLDAKWHFQKPVAAVSLTILFMIGALVSIFRQLAREG